MEPYWNNNSMWYVYNKMKNLKRLALLIVVMLLGSGIGGYLYLINLVSSYSQDVQPSIRATYISMYRARITGDYWENTMLAEHKENVRNKPLVKRLDFYLAVLVQQDLDTSKATIFVNMVGEDSKEFGKMLRNIKDHSVYGVLGSSGNDRIEVWKNNF